MGIERIGGLGLRVGCGGGGGCAVATYEVIFAS